MFNANKNYPKTPKEAYRQKMVINNKKIINFMDNFNMTKTLNNKNNNYSKNNFGGLFQNKKNNKKNIIYMKPKALLFQKPIIIAKKNINEDNGINYMRNIIDSWLVSSQKY